MKEGEIVISEELVEEIADRIRRGRLSGDRDIDVAGELIDRIGQAYADGMPLPGEVGRWIPKSSGGDEAGGGFAWRILKEIGRAPILIALRREEEQDERPR